MTDEPNINIGLVSECIAAVDMTKLAGWTLHFGHLWLRQVIMWDLILIKLYCYFYQKYMSVFTIYQWIGCSGETEETSVADLSVGLAVVDNRPN